MRVESGGSLGSFKEEIVALVLHAILAYVHAPVSTTQALPKHLGTPECAVAKTAIALVAIDTLALLHLHLVDSAHHRFSFLIPNEILTLADIARVLDLF